ncbi:MAG: alpha-hydroxy acid oxidase [Saprospiraceae bacterium]
MSNLSQFPLVQYLEEKARRRIPNVALAYLNCGTGDDRGVQRNIDGLEKVNLTPRFMKGEIVPELRTMLFGREYAAPFGIAPIGLTGLMWPQAEIILAKTAKKFNIPFSLSTVATETPETIGHHVGKMGWFQLYPPRKKELRDDILKRAKDNGFHTLLVTVDVPYPSRRENSVKAGLSMPPKITGKFIYEALSHPAWTVATLKRGLPKLRTMSKYVPSGDTGDIVKFVGENLGFNLSWDYIKEVRDIWHGPMVLKGIVHPEDAEKTVAIGCDGVLISNHGARQFNGGKAAIDSLKEIVPVIKGKTTILFDSGIRSGLDVLKAIAIGADFILLGRSFLWGVAALGSQGGDHVATMIIDDIKNNMMQLGCTSLLEVRHVL